jgi:ubiquinone/menaquinone biosynthesis C-methylase UbiE
MSNEIRFTDGAGYERYMGEWSQLAGSAFLSWLNPPARLRWLDVGCGNGAFTEMIVKQCAPASVDGIDPSEGQLAFARTRPGTEVARFHQGSAMALPFDSASFDAAVMPLVIVFVPDPLIGVKELARVVGPGGLVSAYMWGQDDGGFPYHVLQSEMRSLGIDVPTPPNPDAAQVDVLRNLWRDAGLADVETDGATVSRTFESFDDYLAIIRLSPSVGRLLAAMSAQDFARLESRLRELLPADRDGRITYSARANFVKGRK